MNPEEDEMAWLWKFREELAARHSGDPRSLTEELIARSRGTTQKKVDFSRGDDNAISTISSETPTPQTAILPVTH